MVTKVAERGAPKQLAQPSRKGKKAWRKNVDVADVETGLEDLRAEIEEGGAPLKERPDEALFTIDKGPSEAELKTLRHTRRLKVDEILESRSAIAPIQSRKRSASKAKLTTRKEIEMGLVDPRKTEINKRARKFVPETEVARLKQVAHKGFMGDIVPEKLEEIVIADPWDVEAHKPKKDERMSFLDEKQPIKVPSTLKEAPVALAASGKPMAAVRVPHAGISYNPEFEKWDELLQKEGEKEVALERQRIAERAREAEIRRLAAEIDEDAWDEEDESESESESGEKEVIKKKLPGRKTQAERNKIKRRKEEERRLKQEAQKKRIRQELELVKKLAKQVEEKEKARKEREEQERLSKPAEGEKEMESNEVRKKKFGKIALPRAPLELQLPDELAESLRQLKPEGNLIRDRFRSLRERGIVEVRPHVSHYKQRKVKTTERWSYKDFDKKRW
ncbi:P60-like protein [Ascobolus immersus RN42]|uniref:Ribosome biogenesis protein NOP53 n=1 Tax=Ascobolus immersus RN42 TaxID=1160509 RepID=A0A3N4IN75_ASCIM|nr:P60-like protein [Ascobolus immersus RN42]